MHAGHCWSSRCVWQHHFSWWVPRNEKSSLQYSEMVCNDGKKFWILHESYITSAFLDAWWWDHETADSTCYKISFIHNVSEEWRLFGHPTIDEEFPEWTGFFYESQGWMDGDLFYRIKWKFFLLSSITRPLKWTTHWPKMSSSDLIGQPIQTFGTTLTMMQSAFPLVYLYWANTVYRLHLNIMQ